MVLTAPLAASVLAWRQGCWLRLHPLCTLIKCPVSDCSPSGLTLATKPLYCPLETGRPGPRPVPVTGPLSSSSFQRSPGCFQICPLHCPASSFSVQRVGLTGGKRRGPGSVWPCLPLPQNSTWAAGASWDHPPQPAPQAPRPWDPLLLLRQGPSSLWVGPGSAPVTDSGGLGAWRPLVPSRCPASHPFSGLTLGAQPECFTGDEGVCPQEGHSPSTPATGPGQPVLNLGLG